MTKNEGTVPPGVELLDWHKEAYESDSRADGRQKCRSTDASHLREWSDAYLDGCLTADEYRGQIIVALAHADEATTVEVAKLLAAK